MASRIDLLLNKIQFEGSHIKLPTKVSSLDFYRSGLPKLPLKIRKIYLVRTCLVTVNPTTTTWGITLTSVSIKYRRGICSRPWFFKLNIIIAQNRGGGVLMGLIFLNGLRKKLKPLL